MRIKALFASCALIVTTAAPAYACVVHGRPTEKFWPGVPEHVGHNEVALEVVLKDVRPLDLPQPPTSSDKERVVIVDDCGWRTVIYSYRVLRVLKGQYTGPAEVNSPILVAIEGELADGKSHIVVGQMAVSVPVDQYPPPDAGPKHTQLKPTSLFFMSPPPRIWPQLPMEEIRLPVPKL